MIKTDIYIKQIIDVLSDALNTILLNIDLKHTDDLVQSFRFDLIEEGDDDGGPDTKPFDNLVQIYFELNYLLKTIVESVNLEKLDALFPKRISEDHIESLEAQLEAAKQSSFLPDYFGVDLGLGEISQQMGLSQLYNMFMSDAQETFSWQFFQSLSQADLSPEQKKKGFLKLKTQLQRNVYQFSQIIIKVFVESCLHDLEEFMHKFKSFFTKAIVSYEEKESVIRDFLDEKVPEIQEEYNKVTALIQSQYQQLVA